MYLLINLKTAFQNIATASVLIYRCYTTFLTDVFLTKV